MKTYKQFVAEANKSREINEAIGLGALALGALNWGLRAGAAASVYNRLKQTDKDGKSKPDFTGAALDAVTAINPLGRGANILRNIPVGAGVASLARDAGLDKPVKDAVRPIVQRVKGPKAITPDWLKKMIPDIPGKSSDQERNDTRYSY
tara:strand:- start:1608 stop:2054 length:447 start_codon:yes stop_codon:yes gene_type:complete